ncbi:hypothetical protein ACVWWO_009531 [Bradyrhizobium sp. F1.13.1]
MSEKPKPISVKVKAAIDALVMGEAKDITAAAKLASLSREHLSRELGRPHIAALFRQKVERNLVISAAKAGITKVKLMDSENSMVADRASSYILSLAGITPDTAGASNQRGSQQVPGLVIVINHPPAPLPPPGVDARGLLIDVTPQIITP